MINIRKIKVISFLLALTLLLGTQTKVYGHEIFYQHVSGILNAEPFEGIYLKFNNIVNGKAAIKVNYSGLTSYYSGCMDSVYDAWENSTNYVTVDVVSLNSANVIVKNPTVTEWSDKFGGPLISQNYLGYTILTSTDGIVIDSQTDAINCSGKIRKAEILINPSKSHFNNNSDYIKRTIVHEMGHALGLGHPNGQHFVSSVSSVMRTNLAAYEGYYLPQQHDINDITQKYR